MKKSSNCDFLCCSLHSRETLLLPVLLPSTVMAIQYFTFYRQSSVPRVAIHVPAEALTFPSLPDLDTNLSLQIACRPNLQHAPTSPESTYHRIIQSSNRRPTIRRRGHLHIKARRPQHLGARRPPHNTCRLIVCSKARALPAGKGCVLRALFSTLPITNHTPCAPSVVVPPHCHKTASHRPLCHTTLLEYQGMAASRGTMPHLNYNYEGILNPPARPHV